MDETFPRAAGRVSIAKTIPVLIALAPACSAPPREPQPTAQADPDAGRVIVERVGCASCHTFPDIRWPRGRLGPALDGFADQGLIAGRLPNRPAILARFVRNAPELVPGTAMPAMPLGERESRDVAAYLYTLRR